MTSGAFAPKKTAWTNRKSRPRRIPVSDRWDLSLLFTSVDKWSEDVAWIQQTYPRLTNWKGRAGQSAQTLAEVLEFEKALDLKIERVYHFASLQLAEDSANPEYLARMGALQNLLTRISEASSFLAPEIQAIDDATFAKMLKDPVLADWRIELRKIRRLKPHVLSEREERLLALGSSGWRATTMPFRSSRCRYEFGALRDEQGAERPLTQSSFSSFLVKRDHDCAVARSISSTLNFRTTSSPSRRRFRIR